MRTMIDVLLNIKEQLDWRGPSGRPQGHVVLEREAAHVLIDEMLSNARHDQCELFNEKNFP